MKRFLLPLLLLFATFGAKANSLQVHNTTPCNYWFVLYTIAGPNCNQIKTSLYFIGPNSTINFSSPNAINTWQSVGAPCFNSPGQDFDGFALFGSATTGSPGSIAFVGPNYGWPGSAPFTVPNPCSTGTLQWNNIGPNIQVDIL